MNDEEIRNLFFFLASEAGTPGIENLKVSDVLFGLENYALDIPTENLKTIKYQIEKKERDGRISYDDFRHLWLSYVDYKPNVKEMSNQMFNMISDVLTGAKNEYNDKLEKIDKHQLANLIKLLGLNEHEEEETETGDRRASVYNKKRESIKQNNKQRPTFKKQSEADEELLKIATEMIESIDTDGDEMVSLKDLEFLMGEYISDKYNKTEN